MNEFSLISELISPRAGARADVLLGIGDDGAVVRPPPGEDLVLVLDTLVEAVHFPAGFSAEAIGFRAAATNLSDLAAMGATPRWATLGLTLPQAAPEWVREFMTGLAGALAPHQVQLVGGDTTRGPLCITVQLTGTVPVGQALRRDGAREGDRIFVSGTLGDAAAGLSAVQAGTPASAHCDFLQRRFARPQARVELGRALRGIASSCIDISDGLLADLGHILERSACGALLECARLPLSPALVQHAGRDAARQLALAGGDDYELCFTVPIGNLPRLRELSSTLASLAEIGVITDSAGGLRVLDEQGLPLPNGPAGYCHFA